jgi:hypothetical protein
MANGWIDNIMNQQHNRCDCHECTQARWRMSVEGKIAGIISAPRRPVPPAPVESAPNSTNPLS